MMAARGPDDLPLFREKRINDPARALKALAAEARDCTRCDLYKNATQTCSAKVPPMPR
jgi:uracil-DNA glycosylase